MGCGLAERQAISLTLAPLECRGSHLKVVGCPPKLPRVTVKSGLSAAGTPIATRGLHPRRVHSGNSVWLCWSLVRR